MNLKIVSKIYVTLSNRKRYLLYKIEIASHTLAREHLISMQMNGKREKEREKWAEGERKKYSQST